MERQELVALAEKIDAIDFQHPFVLMADGQIRHPQGGVYAPDVRERVP